MRRIALVALVAAAAVFAFRHVHAASALQGDAQLGNTGTGTVVKLDGTTASGDQLVVAVDFHFRVATVFLVDSRTGDIRVKNSARLATR